MKITKLLFAGLMTIYATVLMAQEAIKVDGIAAIVGKEVILESDVEGAYAQYKASGMDMDDTDKCTILEQFLIEKLLA
ncbi:MAG: peptidylprolyl isomerase, partial [Flavobacteriales bacterium]|nr:peptidylprolyl isomerase [Flavobacteriales bacterium]